MSRTAPGAAFPHRPVRGARPLRPPGGDRTPGRAALPGTASTGLPVSGRSRQGYSRFGRLVNPTTAPRTSSRTPQYCMGMKNSVCRFLYSTGCPVWGW